MQLPLHVSGYDINCQYRKKFDKCMAWFAQNRKSLRSIEHVTLPKTLSVISKFHLPAHKSACHFKFSYHWMTDLFLCPLVFAAWVELQERVNNVEDMEAFFAVTERTSADEDKARGTQAHGEERESLNATQIELPSSFSRDVVRCKSMKNAVELERQLREGQANDALAEVRIHLITEYSLA